MKPIKLTESLIEEMKAEIMKKIDEEFTADKLKSDAESSLAKIKMSDGSFKFSRDFKYEKQFKYEKSDRRAKLIISPVAYAKMLTIIMSQDKEVAWHGTTERISSREFHINDILVYPQEVTASTVDTDEEEYAKWMISLDDEVFNNMHFQGHSHVNMGVFASGTDMGHRDKITTQLGDEDYYVFMIWNKKLEWSGAIYDMPSNTLYETDDIDVEISLGDITAGALIKELDEKVTQYTYQYKGGSKNGATPLYPVYGGANQTNQTSPANPANQKKEEPVGGNAHDNFPGYRGAGAGGAWGGQGYYGGYPYGRDWYD